MSRRRRGLLLAGLALLLGGLAASDVAGREKALERRLGPAVDVVVARVPLRAGTRVRLDQLAVRQVPARFAPAGAPASRGEVVGLRATAPVAAGADLQRAALTDADAARPGAPVRPGERVIDVTAVAAPQAIVPGGRVDVLVTREAGDGTRGRTTLALEDVEVLAAGAAPAADGEGPARVTASLRVTLRQAVFLAAAQSFARELRLLPRAAGDGRRGAAGLSVGDGL